MAASPTPMWPSTSIRLPSCASWLSACARSGEGAAGWRRTGHLTRGGYIVQWRRPCGGVKSVRTSHSNRSDVNALTQTQEAAMSTMKVRSNDMKFEIVVIPVSDVDRAKEFYGRLGWRLDAEFASGDDFRVIQFTPPGSGCSVIFGKNVTAAAPGSARGLYLIVSDIVAAREELRGRGVAVSEVFHSDGAYAGTDEPYLFGRRRTSGPDPERGS